MRPWNGILPPPRGQGYYDGEYVPGLDSIPGVRLIDGDPTKPSFDLNIAAYANDEMHKAVEKAIRETIAFIHSAAESARRAIIIDHLRSLGYTVTPPQESAAPTTQKESS